MALRIVWTDDVRPDSPLVVDTLKDALGRQGRATLLVANAQRVSDCSCALGELFGLGLGVTIATPVSYATDLWDLWGDGSSVVSVPLRHALVRKSLSGAIAAGSHLHADPGTMRLLSSVAAQALPWLPLEDGGEPDHEGCQKLGLTAAETEAMGVLGAYRQALHERGFIEGAEALVGACQAAGRAGASPAPAVALGLAPLDAATRELLFGLARGSELLFIARETQTPASAASHEEVDELRRLCLKRHVHVTQEQRFFGRPSAPERACELEALSEALFTGTSQKIRPQGALSLLLPAGPQAEMECVCRSVKELAQAGACHVVVAAPDAGRLWRELAPKLFSRGLSVKGRLSEGFSELEAGRAFLGFARTVTQLAELARNWPQEELSSEGPLVRLGDMSWWPPAALVDFLLSDLSGVDASRAWSLDRSWRKDRLLTPRAVLETLLNPGKTSEATAGATRELLKGRLGAAVARLARGMRQPGGAPAGQQPGSAAPGVDLTGVLGSARSRGVLTAVGEVSEALEEVYGPHAVPEILSGTSLVELAAGMLGDAHVVTRPEALVKGSACTVELLDVAHARLLAPGSADALVLMGQTTEASPVPRLDDERHALLAAFGVEAAGSALERTRRDLWQLVAIPTRRLVLERTLFDAGSKPTHPSLGMVEILALYGDSEDAQSLGIHVQELSETRAQANLALSGEAPAIWALDSAAPAGRVSSFARPLIVVPPEGLELLPDGRPVLSASQIETYLECPYKWFSLRRLRLRDSDAGFGAMEMGTFAHRVLELTHTALLTDALAQMGPDAPDLAEQPAARVPLSRVTPDAEGLARARLALDAAFAQQQQEQRLKKRNSASGQALVPHNAEQRGRVVQLKRDLASLMEYEAGLFWGYEPRWMEWGFGRHGELVSYAGAWISGTIDRVDVDAHGNACVIDYKHKAPEGFASEYASLDDAGALTEGLPRRVQALIYAQVLRRMRPDLVITAATYLSTRSDRAHVLAGAVAADASENVFGEHLPSKAALARMSVSPALAAGGSQNTGMEALLDATEAAIAGRVRELVSGNIEARPAWPDSCSFCPVMNCERRLS